MINEVKLIGYLSINNSSYSIDGVPVVFAEALPIEILSDGDLVGVSGKIIYTDKHTVYIERISIIKPKKGINYDNTRTN
jgi:hypothetical protein